jgi:hypothetical protein
MSTLTPTTHHPSLKALAYVLPLAPQLRLPRASRLSEYKHTRGKGHADQLDMQKGFWGTIAVFPVGWGLYFISRPESADSPPMISRWIDEYTRKQDHDAAINDLHVQMIEQAGTDRVLFMNSRPQDHVEMKFPEYVI